MNKRDKQIEVFLELVNKQLEPHGKCFEDVKSDPEWYMRFKTTHEQEDVFIKWGVDLLRTKLKMSAKMAENEMSWFILQWGLTTNQEQLPEMVKVEKPARVVKRTK